MMQVITSKVLRSPPWLGWPLWNICVTNDNWYVPLVVNTSRSFAHSRLITGFVTRLTRQVPLVEQELLTLPEHLSSPPVFSGVRVTRSLVLYVCFVDRYLSFGTFSFGHCVVCSSSIYGFWLPPFGIFKLFLCIFNHFAFLMPGEQFRLPRASKLKYRHTFVFITLHPLRLKKRHLLLYLCPPLWNSYLSFHCKVIKPLQRYLYPSPCIKTYPPYL